MRKPPAAGVRNRPTARAPPATVRRGTRSAGVAGWGSERALCHRSATVGKPQVRAQPLRGHEALSMLGPAMTGREVVGVSGLGANVVRRLDSAPRGLGRVHSVFERAVNVLGDDDRLLAFHGPARLAAPFAIALAEPPPLAAFALGAALAATSAGFAIGGVFLDLRQAEGAKATLASFGAPGAPVRGVPWRDITTQTRTLTA